MRYPGRQSLNKELTALHETRARYVAGAEARAIREAGETREASIRADLARRDALAYAQGRVYTIAGVVSRPADIFSEQDPGTWANRLAEVVLQAAFPRLPFDFAAFPHTLTASHMADLFGGIFHGDVDAEDLVRAFGPPLGLTRSDAATEFDAGDCASVEAIRDAVQGAGGQAPAAELGQILVQRHGLNRPLATLYVLAYVRLDQGEVTLLPGHSVGSRSGGLFPTDVVGWDTLSEITFSESLSDDLRQVRERPAHTWSAVLPYAIEIVRDLEPVDESEAPGQEERLLVALKDMGQRLQATREVLAPVATGLGERGDESLTVVDRLVNVAESDGFHRFHTAAQAAFGGPRGLRQALDLYARLERLGELAPDVTRERIYLDEMTFGSEHQVLRLERDALAARVGLDHLMANPAVWDGIAEGVQAFRRTYATAYAGHHRRYHEAADDLRNRHRTFRPQVDALARFNEVVEFGEPLEPDAPGRLSDLLATVRECPAPDEVRSLGDAPYCQSCMLPLDEDVPVREAESLYHAVEHAMAEYNRRLGSRGVQRILAHPTREQLDQFINLAQVSDLSSLANVLDDSVVEFLRRFMSDDAAASDQA